MGTRVTWLAVLSRSSLQHGWHFGRSATLEFSGRLSGRSPKISFPRQQFAVYDLRKGPHYFLVFELSESCVTPFSLQEGMFGSGENNCAGRQRGFWQREKLVGEIEEACVCRGALKLRWGEGR